MRRSGRLIAVVGFLVLGIGTAFAVSSLIAAHAQSNPAVAPPRGDVVMMRCNTAGTEFSVALLQGSAGSPGKQTGGCADNLSALLKAGFTLRDIGHYDDEKSNFTLFTLLR